MTFTISKRTFISLGAVLAVALAALAAGYLAGQASRKSEDAVALLVNHKVTAANEAVNAERDITQAKAVKTAVKQAKHGQWRKDQKRWKKYAKKLVAKAHAKGYAEGNTAGYSAGTSAGYSSGHSAGVDDGIDEASDELVCSDDSDVALPSCSWDW
jgi:flagellar biosynthesis/type III secretory pathway protein FliH